MNVEKVNKKRSPSPPNLYAMTILYKAANFVRKKH